VASASLRIGIMGGTFDPIHHAHLVTACQAVAQLGLDRIVLVPVGIPWQKEPGGISPAEDRYAMTAIAAAFNPRMSVSRMEIERPGPSYSAETLREFRRTVDRDTALFLILGADAAAGLSTWYDAESVPRLAQLVVCSRFGYSLARSRPPGGDPVLIEFPAQPISSTAIRERVRRAEPVRHLVPDGVATYISRRGLYVGSPAHGVCAHREQVCRQAGVRARHRDDVRATPCDDRRRSGGRGPAQPAGPLAAPAPDAAECPGSPTCRKPARRTH
jgi:nicotinate-nucleotide adenylyltransferase